MPKKALLRYVITKCLSLNKANITVRNYWYEFEITDFLKGKTGNRAWIAIN